LPHPFRRQFIIIVLINLFHVFLFSCFFFFLLTLLQSSFLQFSFLLIFLPSSKHVYIYVSCSSLSPLYQTVDKAYKQTSGMEEETPPLLVFS
jgi:hypothetical protein